jgi:hypothetical protein
MHLAKPVEQADLWTVCPACPAGCSSYWPPPWVARRITVSFLALPGRTVR